MDMDHNTHCYTFEPITFERGVLDETVDCTYIIHLLDNGRIEHIYSEINRIPTTKKVILVCNKGYKKCDKQLIDQEPYQDLTDAFLQCMKHAKAQSYKNVLVLEDDFIFDDTLADSVHAQNIHRFFTSHKNENFIYYLGAIPLIMCPATTDLTTYKSIKTMTAHAIIYSETFVNKYEQMDLKYKHWDIIMDKNVPSKYIYYTPLCYQPFPETENKQVWIEKHKSVLLEYLQNVFIQSFGMNKDPVAGFHFIYFVSNILCVLCVGFFISIFVLVVYLTMMRSKRSRRRYKPKPK